MITLSSAAVARHVGAAIPTLATQLRPDFLAALQEARRREPNARAQAVLDQLLENASIAASQHLPLCQDTGYVWVCLEVWGSVCVPANIFKDVDKAVAQAYTQAALRKSLLADALLNRTNTQQNTPAFCELIVHSANGDSGNDPQNPWDRHPVLDTGSSPTAAAIDDGCICSKTQDDAPRALLHIMLKGGGSDNASRVVMLTPGEGAEGVKRTLLEAVRAKGANACPPLVVGVGVGATFDKVAGLAKHSLLRPLGEPNPNPELDALEHEWLAAVNATDIGPGGFGGATTALAVHIQTAPCHIAALPVAINMGCSAMRSTTIDLLV